MDLKIISWSILSNETRDKYVLELDIAGKIISHVLSTDHGFLFYNLVFCPYIVDCFKVRNIIEIILCSIRRIKGQIKYVIALIALLLMSPCYIIVYRAFFRSLNQQDLIVLCWHYIDFNFALFY